MKEDAVSLFKSLVFAKELVSLTAHFIFNFQSETAKNCCLQSAWVELSCEARCQRAGVGVGGVFWLWEWVSGYQEFDRWNSPVGNHAQELLGASCAPQVRIG